MTQVPHGEVSSILVVIGLSVLPLDRCPCLPSCQRQVSVLCLDDVTPRWDIGATSSGGPECPWAV